MHGCFDRRGEPGEDDETRASRGIDREELTRLLDDIRSPIPSAAEVVEVVRSAAAGELSPCRLDQIARDIHALYRHR
jgi:hypothetical protein